MKNVFWIGTEMEQEQNYKELAVKIVDKLKEIRYTYPGISDSLEELQIEMKGCMEKMHKSLLILPDLHKDLLTLLVISEIHKTLDEIFKPQTD